MEHNPFEGYSFSWTQPYSVSMNPFYQINTKDHNIEKEMAVVEAVDHLVESGLTHPAADAILMKLKQL